MIAASRVEAKWQLPRKLHLTLAFLGNPVDLAPLAAKVDVLVARLQPFTLALRGAGVFVTERAPSVLWLGVGGDLGALHALERDAARELGDSGRPYVPHVTLARAKAAGAFDETVRELSGFTGTPFEVRGLTLYESTHHQFRVVHQKQKEETPSPP